MDNFPGLLKSLITVGLDVGYGATKIVANHLPPQIFPSVCGHAVPLDFQESVIAERYPGDRLTDNEGSWYIGDLAQNQLTQPGELLRLQGRTADEQAIGNVFRQRMAKAAIGKLLAGRVQGGDAIHMRIATGLPVEHMADAADLKAALLGQHHIHTDQADFVANVVEVIVMPQPYGTIYAHTMTPAGEINENHSYTRTGVLDVGNYTIDLTLDDAGEYINAESGGIEAGVYTAQEHLRKVLENKYRQFIPLAVIDEVLRTGRLMASGKPVDFTREVEKALEPLCTGALALMQNKWKTGALVDIIYLSGGGATFVEKAVKAVYPQAHLLENAQIANAQGYLYFGLYRMSHPVEAR